MKKGVFFDAGGTLFEVRESVGFHYSRFALKFGVQMEAGHLNGKFREAFASHRPMSFPGIAAVDIPGCERRWWYDLVSTVCPPALFPDFDRFFAEVYDFFGQPEAWSLFPETVGVLSRLREEGYALGLISNFDSRLIHICRGLGMSHFFNTITFSSRAGVAKPSPEIFRIALKKAGIDPCEALYVGDSPGHDVEGPRQIGMQVLLLDRTGRHKHIPQIERIDNLCSVLDHL